MSTATAALLHDLIDYAGMFPPAQLPFATAYQQFLDYRTTSENGILARFICPIANFDLFCDALTNNPQEANPVRMSALGGEKSKELTSTEEFATELTYLKMLSDAHPNDLRIESYEAKLSKQVVIELSEDPYRDLASPRLSNFGEGVLAGILARENDSLRVFFELPFNGFTVSAMTLSWFIDELARINTKLMAANRLERVGMKLRCGGDMVPVSFMIATVLTKCASNHVPFKATAGLHHPFFSNSRSERHGFVSVFLAGVLAHANQIDNAEYVAEIVSDDKANHVVISDDGITWNDKYSATTEQIVAARRDIFQSFGSCSFEEPISDLKQHGWII